MDIFILTNSPGEISAWVRPVVPRILERESDARIYIVLTPCPYASGREAQVVKDIPGIHRVIKPDEWRNLTFLHPFPRAVLKVPDKGVVVHMGGDILNSAIFATRLGLPAVAYTHRANRWRGPYKEYMVKDEKTKEYLLRRNLPSEMVTVVGDIMVDSVEIARSREETRESLGIPSEAFVISILPGSRPHEVKYMTPFLLKVAELLKKERADVRFALLLSPFASLDDLASAIDKTAVEQGSKILSGTAGEVVDDANGPKIITEKGTVIKIVQEGHYDVMNSSDLALTCPGTKTAELAILGVPMVVITPLNKPELIPIDGIGNFVEKIPLVGKNLKGRLVMKFADRMEFVALPNIKAERKIVPELVGILQPADVAISTANLIADEDLLTRTSEELKKVMGPGGASEKVADIIIRRAEG